jgi:hypothetical protein
MEIPAAHTFIPGCCPDAMIDQMSSIRPSCLSVQELFADDMDPDETLPGPDLIKVHEVYPSEFPQNHCGI